ncbi:MAG: HypC/HybG/HupF family hydrogenase formation chaperone [Actinobacteria bacterium]|nr:HypC/HybG/HupF family hydrogenase formation chaperone [Actinomycetota bacterium]
MCLAIPAKIRKITENVAEVESLGVTRKVDISLVPDAKVGDYVIVHAGFAIQIVDKEDAFVTQGYWEEYLEDLSNGVNQDK